LIARLEHVHAHLFVARTALHFMARVLRRDAQTSFFQPDLAQTWLNPDHRITAEVEDG
jgi:hypothetical protein